MKRISLKVMDLPWCYQHSNVSIKVRWKTLLGSFLFPSANRCG